MASQGNNPFEDLPTLPSTASPGQAIANPFETLPDLPTAHAAVTDEIKGAQGGVKGWLNDLETDVRTGSGFTAVGRALKAVGYQGVNNGAQAQAGDFMGSMPLGAVHATQGIADTPQHPIKGPVKAVSGALEMATIPSAFMSPATGEIAGEGGAAVSDAASAAGNAFTRMFSKGAVTKDMGGKISSALDQVAADAGLPASQETSLSAKTTDIVGGLKKQAQTLYGQLDQASGGRYQRFVDEIDELQDALRNKYLPPDAVVKTKKQLAEVQQAYADTQQQLVAQGVDPATIAQADSKWAQAKALETVGKKFRAAETLSGDLKPGTPSVDTGLKNLKPHILPQATKSQAAPITEAVTDATADLNAVKRNQKIAAVAGALTGMGTTGAIAGRVLDHFADKK